MILMVKEFRVCSMSVNLHGNQPVEVTRDLRLIDARSSFDQFEITQVSHCDGLLLLSHEGHNRIVVWNPCTGQTRWTQSKNHWDRYALGSYRDKKSDGNSYKILSYKSLGDKDQELAIYEIKSDSWRILDVTCDCRREYNEYGMF
ncbi:putative F-box protein [Cardamine amara subsp. amara]|uniref:F-box protein n=1 Tax=Cardamine amara subsp. amara TaxID=228776 RepID=A0ABD0YZF2_CARAN